MPNADRLDELTWQELRVVLDEEVGKLAEKFSAPIILCYFEGKSHDQAAKELGCPKNTVTSRLARGRELLHRQLVGRGITLSLGALAMALAEKATAAPVGAMLTLNTGKLAAIVASGKVVAGSRVSARAIALAEQAMAGMIGLKAKALLLVLTLGLAVGGTGIAGFAALAGKSPAAAKAARGAPTLATAPVSQSNFEKASPPKKDVLTDIYGDPLPEGAVARLGTVRFRHAFATRALAFAPDGKILASAGSPGFGSVCLWDPATGKALQRLMVPNYVGSLAFSPDSKMLALAGEYLSLIDPASGKELHRVNAPAGAAIETVAFSFDGRTIAFAENDGPAPAVVLWDAITQKEVHRLKGPRDSVLTIAFSPDGKVLASIGDDNHIRLWDVPAGKEIRQFEAPEKGTQVVTFSFVTFAPSGKILAALCEDGVIRIWEVATGKYLRELKLGHGSMRRLAFSPDGKQLASGERNGTIHLWDPETGKQLRHWQASTKAIQSLAFSPDGKVLATGGSVDHAIRLWDPNTGNEFNPATGHTGIIEALRFAPDGKTLFSCGQDWKVLEWDIAGARERRQVFTGPTNLDELRYAIFGLSQDGNILATSYREGQKPLPGIHLWDTAQGKELRTLNKGGDGITGFWLSPDGKLLASSDNKEVFLWDVATGNILQTLPKADAEKPQVVFSANGRLLAYAGANKILFLWDAVTHKVLRSWQHPHRYLGRLVFSPDGKVLASSGGGSSLCLWNTESGKELRQVGLRGLADSLVFSRNGRILAAVMRGSRTLIGGDSLETETIHFLEVLTGQEIRQIDVPQGPVWAAAAFAPDGRTFATGGTDSTILLWDATGLAKDGKLIPTPLTAKELNNLWSDLAAEAAPADLALWKFALAPKQSLPFLKDRMRPLPPAAADKVAKLVADLDSESFAIRQKAAQSLDALGEAAENMLRKTLDGKLTLEVKQRVELILEKRKKDTLRKLRAIEAVEHIGTAEARQILQTLVAESANPQVSEAARAALARGLKMGPSE